MSKHFHRQEFACRCGCGFAAMDEELIARLEEIRTMFGNKPITITSGCRCQEHNRKIKGSENSYHTKGMAADFKVRGIAAHAVSDRLRREYPQRYGIGQYPSWTHLDVRPGDPARWYQT